jgi:hypothetical protein
MTVKVAEVFGWHNGRQGTILNAHGDWGPRVLAEVSAS